MENNEILNQFIQILMPVLATFITGVFTYIGNKKKNAYQKKINDETAKTVVKDVVRFVEQVYGDIHGKEKLQKAIEQVSIILQEKGIKITETEIMMLIESAVYGLNEGLNPKDVKDLINETKTEIQALNEAVNELKTPTEIVELIDEITTKKQKIMLDRRIFKWL